MKKTALKISTIYAMAAMERMQSCIHSSSKGYNATMHALHTRDRNDTLHCKDDRPQRPGS